MTKEQAGEMADALLEESTRMAVDMLSRLMEFSPKNPASCVLAVCRVAEAGLMAALERDDMAMKGAARICARQLVERLTAALEAS